MTAYQPRRTLVIEVDIQSAMADERLFAKVRDLMTSGEGDVVHYGVSRVVRRAKSPKDAVDIGPMRIDWKTDAPDVYAALWAQASPEEEVILDTLARCAGLTTTLKPETDRQAHERFAAMADPEEALAALDAKYHDHLPEGANCRLCGVEHSAINPSAL